MRGSSRHVLNASNKQKYTEFESFKICPQIHRKILQIFASLTNKLFVPADPRGRPYRRVCVWAVWLHLRGQPSRHDLPAPGVRLLQERARAENHHHQHPGLQTRQERRITVRVPGAGEWRAQRTLREPEALRQWTQQALSLQVQYRPHKLACLMITDAIIFSAPRVCPFHLTPSFTEKTRRIIRIPSGWGSRPARWLTTLLTSTGARRSLWRCGTTTCRNTRL